MNRPFHAIVAEHGQTVLRVCRAVLGSHADADDAWSETFLAAMRTWPQLPEDANVEAWLVTIAHRKAIDATRSRQRNATPVGDLPEQTSTLGVPASATYEIWEVVRTLPPKQRQAVAYRYLAGLSHQEVAEILGGTVEAARRAAADGIRSLRATLRAQDTIRKDTADEHD
ncbi:MAG TPA: sigma-70 family RNA polymerase sigma factor [Jiangellaceae bacterium]|nr:sigma-70 family RNA polymerase sigma factor [Jiangellaceae bacterium]